MTTVADIIINRAYYVTSHGEPNFVSIIDHSVNRTDETTLKSKLIEEVVS